MLLGKTRRYSFEQTGRWSPNSLKGFEEKAKERDVEVVKKIKEEIHVDRESEDETEPPCSQETTVAEKRNKIEEGCSEKQEEEH